MATLFNALLSEQLITQEQLGDAKDKQLGAKRPVQELLVDMGFITEEKLVEVSSRVFDMPPLDLDNEKIDPSLIELIPCEAVKRYGVFPVKRSADVLVLAMSNPQDIIAIDDMKFLIDGDVAPVFATKSQIAKYIETFYKIDDTLYDIFKNITDEAKIELLKDENAGNVSFDEPLNSSEGSPVVRLVNFIIGQAVKNRASDIHIEAQEKFVNVRFRIDGDLRNTMRVSVKHQKAIASRIKVLADLDIAEIRKFQDGRIKLLVDGRKIDLRISFIPVFYGEKIVIRILDAKEAKVSFDKIGFNEKEADIFTNAISRPYGMILLTGPTGSGKTSTIYAALNSLRTMQRNITTIEDPIEYLIEGINQMQINPIKNVTFASGLSSILRQDPDVIMVGEVRDLDTAKIAFRSSLTGHLIFSTLHTNTAVSSITRLLDLGLESFQIASALVLIVAQRLVKVICLHCKEEYSPDEQLLDDFNIYLQKYPTPKFYRGKGCQHCNFTGFRGRTAVFEMLEINENIRQLIASQSPERIIYEEARKNKFCALLESGVEKVVEGVTTFEELSKVVDVMPRRTVPEEPVEQRDKKKILVADDEEDILDALEFCLNHAGYNVVKARNGEELVKYALRESPDLIITDMMMPKMTGLEAVKILRSGIETAVTPIIMLTARTDKKSELESINAGVDDYLTKPFDYEKVLARIKMIFRRKT